MNNISDKLVVRFMVGAWLVCVLFWFPLTGQDITVRRGGGSSSSSGGSFANPTVTRFRTNDVVTISTNFYIYECSSDTNIIWFLPAAASSSNFTFVLKKIGAGSPTLTCNGTDKFNGTGSTPSTVVLASQFQATMFYSDGISSWYLY